MKVDGFSFFVKAKNAVPNTQNSLPVINMGGVVSTENNYVKFTTTGAATVKVTYFQGGAGRYCKIIGADGKDVASDETDKTTADKALHTGTMSISSAGTYYLGSANSGIYITEVSVTLK